MAVNLTVAAVAAAIRAGNSTEETAEVERLLAYATEAIDRHLGDAYAGTPVSVVNEAAIRLVGYLYDQPMTARGAAYANAMRNSGAARILLPYLVHRAPAGEAVAAAQAAVGTPGNPVVDVEVSGSTLTITFEDGTTRDETLPASTGDDAAPWAEAGNTDMIPAEKYRAPTSTERGAPYGATNNDIDEGAGARTGVLLAYTINHLKRLIARFIPSWVSDPGTTIPSTKFGVESIDHNKLGNNSVRRRHLDDDAVGIDEVDDVVTARLLPAVDVADNGKVATVSAGAWVAADATPGGGSKPHWYEMAQLLTSSLASGTAADMTLRADGLTVFADAAAVRTAIGNGTISMLALQRSDSDAVVPGIIAPNFVSSAAANYAVQFRFPNGEEATVRFTTSAITVTPSFTISDTFRFDLGVFT